MPIYALDNIEPILPEDGRYWLAPDVHIIGDVVIGEDVGVWFGAVLRGDNERITIEAGSNIQEGAMLHTDLGFPMTVGQGCTIGHHAILHGCTIGENTLIGMGAVIMNGAKIGRNCLVAANALITEGKEYPDHSLIVGSPARVVKSVDDATITRLKASASHYIDNWKRYANGLKKVD
jgi:carbonic anhydrase/acetyltransferase-like protein (isoleucine patch superfamily)